MEIIKDGIIYRLDLTGMACPEQYDVYVGEEQVGYLRLRHGCFTVDYPDYGGECVYDSTALDGDGSFSDDIERNMHLDNAINAIHKKRSESVDIIGDYP